MPIATPEAGTITKSCLSQWYPAAFTVDGQHYRTAEHWMMAEKARLFGDYQAAAAILGASTPKAAKAIGRQVCDFDNQVWAAHRREIVTQGNLEKFRQNRPLLKFLLATAGTVLVEASPHDQIWGIGLRQDDPRAMDPAQWRGSNLLGFALGDVQAEQRE